jgi:hypothetical protein
MLATRTGISPGREGSQSLHNPSSTAERAELFIVIWSGLQVRSTDMDTVPSRGCMVNIAAKP